MPALLQPQPALRLDRPDPANERLDGHFPRPPELTRKRLGGTVTSLERAVAVGRDEGEHLYRWPDQRLDDDRSRDPREVTLPALLPGRDQLPGGAVVDDRRAGRRERKPPSPALGAATDRPGAR